LKEARSIPLSSKSWGVIRIVFGRNTFDFYPRFSDTPLPLAHVAFHQDAPWPLDAVHGTATVIAGVATGKETNDREIYVTAWQMRKIGTTARPMLDAFSDAVSDFPGTLAQAERGHYTPKPHQKGNNKPNTPSSNDDRPEY
jgi:hypothetical protein